MARTMYSELDEALDAETTTDLAVIYDFTDYDTILKRLETKIANLDSIDENLMTKDVIETKSNLALMLDMCRGILDSAKTWVAANPTARNLESIAKVLEVFNKINSELIDLYQKLATVKAMLNPEIPDNKTVNNGTINIFNGTMDDLLRGIAPAIEGEIVNDAANK